MSIKNNWIKENNEWYFYKDNKKLNTQWIKYNERWYYLEKDGHMVKGWFQTTKDNTWYYASTEETIKDNDIFYEGQLCTGWLKEHDNWYFFEDNNENKLGAMYCNGIYKINNKYHKFDNKGVWIGEVRNREENFDFIISDELCDFIAYFEGCRLKAYYCSSGILTIGIGCTRKEITSLCTITKEKAYEEFKKDLSKFARTIDDLCNKSNVTLNSYERDALISFVFNCGSIALEKSTLWYNITKGIRDKDIITENFLRFVKSSSGQVLDGLIRRRKLEAKLFLYGIY